MKKIYSCLGLLLFLIAKTTALSFTSTISGNWNSPATWGMSGTPTEGVNFPGASDDANISASNTVTLTANANVNNLTINVNAGLLDAGNFTLNVNGTVAATSTAIPSNVINTGASGIVKFVGSSRALFGANWGAANQNWRCEVALTTGQIGTCVPANKFGYLKVTSGTFDITGILLIDSASGDGFGVIDIAANATLLVRSRVGLRTATTSTFCRAINIDGVLEMNNNTTGMFINGQNIFVNNGGTLRLRRGGVSGFGGNSQLSSAPTGGTNFVYATGSTLEYINNFSTVTTSSFVRCGAELTQGKISSGSSGQSVFNLTIDAINDNEIQLIGSTTIYGTVTMKRGFFVAPFGSTLSYQPGTTLKYNASVAQIGTGQSAVNIANALVVYPNTSGLGPSNLIIDNPSGVTFNNDGSSHQLPIALIFTNGKLSTPSTNPFILLETASIIGADATGGKYIDGLFQKITNSTSPLILPTGAGSVAHFMTVIPGTSTTTTWQVQYFNTNPISAVGGTFVSPISGITNTEYWDLSRAPNTGNAQVELTWSSPIAGASLTDNIRVAHWNGSGWEDYGSNSVVILGNSASGTVRSNAVSNFSPITIGFAPAAALPVKLISFAAVKEGPTATVNWKVADAKDAKRYELYESNDGRSFQLLTTIAGDANKDTYTVHDNNLFNGSNYYRLKVYDVDGSFYYSKIVVIFNNSQGIEILGMAPTLVNSSANLSVTSSARSQINIMISDVQGRIMQRMTKEVAAGDNSINLNLSNLPGGTYQLTALTADGTVKTIRFVKL